ncbi:MAG TPA: PASTA domain-containing protein [Candidatus Krumholzibacteria bacterium]|nr:PASTA domain-containing protein [Candidatus Krumholzibacteria bacterium]
MKLWKFLLLLVTLALVGGAVVLGLNFLVMPSIVHHNEVVAMPDLRGLSLAQAQQRLNMVNLELVVARQRAHPTIGEGLILDQLPAPDQRVRGGRTVQVITSSGPPAGALPRLAGLSLRQAEVTLQRENYRVGRVLRIRRAGVSEPVVAYQNPIAGVETFKGAVVDLVVAEPAPAELLRMPDLVGSPLFQARQAAAEAGFVVGPVRYERTGRVAPNTVIAQEPAAGTRISKGDRLELVASSR